MSLLIKAVPGITNLSELTIDADKSWALKAISQLAGLDAGQVRGDIWIFNFEDHANLIVRRLQAMEEGKILCSRGANKPPFWAWGWEEPGLTSALERYYAALIDLTHDEGIVTIDQSHNENAPMTSEHKQAYGDAPADYIKRLTPAILCPDAQAIVAADQSHNENAPVTRKYDLEIVVGGAVAYDVDDATPYDDETTAAQNDTANDMTLLPATPALNDAYYFGHAKKFDVMIQNIGTSGAGTWTITWEYWNGSAWVALVDLTDGTSGFTAATGKREVSHTPQGVWATTNEGGNLPATIYWIRARVSAYTSITTQPLGTQSWIRIIT